jgi:hypothetical protein
MVYTITIIISVESLKNSNFKVNKQIFKDKTKSENETF